MRSKLYAAAGACLAAAAFALPGLANVSPAAAATTAVKPTPRPAVAAPATTNQPATLPSGAKEACPRPSGKLQEQCQSFIFPHKAKSPGANAPADASEPLTPTDLQEAYGLTSLSSSKGTGETIAIVDAFGDSTAAADLTAYRLKYSLPACTTSNGCLNVYDENGGTSLPADPTGDNAHWRDEISLDLDMVSAICPDCHIDLYEANSNSTVDLGTADDTAAAKDKFVSNSWSGEDFPGESSYDSYFNHPGVVMAFASGDLGYGAGYPASSQFVTSVGGTYLTGGGSSAWTQTAWNVNGFGATGSGCSAEPKPAWQTDTGCADRTENDVSAVADSPNHIDVISSADGGDIEAGGTSAATPIITAIYALAGNPTPDTYPASYPYQDPTGLTDITSGSDGTCESSRTYLCTAGTGYDGPTGLGTPNQSGNLTPFTESKTDDVSVAAPGNFDLQTGIDYTFPAVQGHDTSGNAIAYSASGLPAGLSIDSGSGVISGKISAEGTYTVSVTANDGTASSTASFKIGVSGALTAAYHAAAGPVKLNWNSKCLDDAGNSSANGNKVQIWACNGGAGQNWTYEPDTDPGDAGEVVINGKCLDIKGYGTTNGSLLDLWSCSGAANQQWYIVGADGELYNPASGKCIDDPYHSTANGTQLDIWDCNGQAWQAWTLPASPVLSGIDGKCMDDTNDSNANGNVIQLYNCNGQASQKFTVGLDGSVQIQGKCLDATGYGTNDGTKVQLYACGGTSNQVWQPTGYGQLENLNAEKCLDVTSSANHTQLVLEDCYGDQGSIWAET